MTSDMLAVEVWRGGATVARLRGDEIVMDNAPVVFARVKPGESLLAHAAE